MNFTREPIVETVISAKEGFKLVIRNSKGSGQEEFFVDAVEVISFGSSCFYRSLEKPKSFLVPINDYEILESREARISLKTTSVDRGIKIGGGKASPKKAEKEDVAISEVEEAVALEQKAEKRRDRRRTRKKKVTEQPEEQPKEAAPAEIKPPPSLIPPPPQLISESFAKPRKEEEGKEESEKKSPVEDSSDSSSEEKPESNNAETSS